MPNMEHSKLLTYNNKGNLKYESRESAAILPRTPYPKLISISSSYN
jgi:hypothetical protein